MTKYLVTGGAGFIGSHLIDALLSREEEVVVLDSLSTGRLANLNFAGQHPSMRFVQGSILDELIVDELVHECDVVVHLAAAVGVRIVVEQPLRSLITNLRGCEIVIEAAHRYRRTTLLASTSEVYGKAGTHGELSEDSDCVMGSPSVSRWAYALSKRMDEVLGYAYYHERGLPIVVARLFNTVGARQSPEYGMVVPRLVRQALAGEPLTIHGDGQQTRCFCHVSDAVEALMGLLNEPRAIGRVFNVGSREEISILDLAKRILKMTDSRSRLDFVPYSQVYGSGFEDMGRRVPDTARINQLIGWTTTRTLDQILSEVIAEATSESILVSG